MWNRKIDRNYVKMRPGEVHIEIALDSKPMKEILDYELKYQLDETNCVINNNKFVKQGLLRR